MAGKSYDTILIGGSGFIGSALAEALSKRGETVLSISRNKSEILPPGVDEVILDLTQREPLVFPYAKTVFILVGQNSANFNASQELQTLEKLVAALNVIQPEKVFYLSSVLAYGERPEPASENDALIPLDPYSRYKADAEALLQRGLAPKSKLGILRLANVYGSPQNTGFIGVLMKYVSGGVKEDIRVNGDGRQERDYIFLDDVIAAMLAVKENLKTNDIINIASGKSETLLELIACMEKVSQNKLSYRLGGETGEEIRCSRITNSKLQKEYHFAPEYSLLQGLQKTLERYKK